MGVVTRFDLHALATRALTDPTARIGDILRRTPHVAHPDEPLRSIVSRMAETGLTHFPVVEPGDGGRLLGMISLEDLLKARVRTLEAEHRREQVMRVRLVFPFAFTRGRVGRSGAREA
jgi:CIC family chloride channel protein